MSDYLHAKIEELEGQIALLSSALESLENLLKKQTYVLEKLVSTVWPQDARNQSRHISDDGRTPSFDVVHRGRDVDLVINCEGWRVLRKGDGSYCDLVEQHEGWADLHKELKKKLSEFVNKPLDRENVDLIEEMIRQNLYKLQMGRFIIKTDKHKEDA